MVSLVSEQAGWSLGTDPFDKIVCRSWRIQDGGAMGWRANGIGKDGGGVVRVERLVASKIIQVLLG